MPRPGRIFEVAERFRRELLAREREAATEMVRYYGEIWKRIKARLDEFTRQIAEARAAGKDVSPAWLFQLDRLGSLQRQVEAEIWELTRYAEQSIIAQQAEAIRTAQEHAEQLALAGMGEPPPGVAVSWDRLPTEALTDLVGFLQNGSPLRELLGELPGQAGQAVADALVQGVALGLNPREVARQVRRSIGMSMVRVLRIARTETLRVYREATRRSYQANSDIVKGWIWHSALDKRTCAACWAMHGTKHGLDERLDDHPNGRCAMLPWTATWRELGFEDVPETRVEVEPGEEVFARQPEEVQRQVLGDAGYEAWRAGAVRLRDFVGRKRSREWGTTRYARSLRDILGPKRARQYRRSGYRALAQRIEAFEREIVGLRYEVARAWDTEGNVVVDKAGGANYVSFTDEEKQAMRNCILTHNHPGGWAFPEDDVRRAGNSFSEDDIQFAAEAELREIRAISPGYIHVMRPPAGGWNADWAHTKLIPEYERQTQAVRNEFLAAIMAGQMRPQEAEARHFHEVWTRVAESLGLDYTRQRRQ